MRLDGVLERDGSLFLRYAIANLRCSRQAADGTMAQMSGSSAAAVALTDGGGRRGARRDPGAHAGAGRLGLR